MKTGDPVRSIWAGVVSFMGVQKSLLIVASSRRNPHDSQPELPASVCCRSAGCIMPFLLVNILEVVDGFITFPFSLGWVVSSKPWPFRVCFLGFFDLVFCAVDPFSIDGGQGREQPANSSIPSTNLSLSSPSFRLFVLGTGRFSAFALPPKIILVYRALPFDCSWILTLP